MGLPWSSQGGDTSGTDRYMRVLCAIALVLLGAVPGLQAQQPLVHIYIAQHPEVDVTATDPGAIPLSANGHQRAALLVPTLSSIKLTHLIGSHTLRSRQTLEPLSRAHSLPIRQYPQPGSRVNGTAVDDQLTRQAAIEPVSAALLGLPAGSSAFVALNSDNIFAIFNRLGVPLKTDCGPGQPCVPCLNNTCWPAGAPDRLWHLAIPAGKPAPVIFTELRYGAGWSPR
jgi:hypothetical protein